MGHERLESRSLLSAGSASLTSAFSATQIAEPSEAETLLLYLVNRTRQFPQQWASRLSVSLSSDQRGPFAPVVSNASLLHASRLHSQEMLSRGTLSHTGANGSSPGDRAVLAGYPTSSVGENVGYDAGYGSYTADAIAQRMNDAWFTSSGHRANMLTANWTEFGGAFAIRQPPGGTQYATELFGRVAAGPFLTGVVFADRNADLDFDATEGLGGVTVTATGPAGTFTTTTLAAGGWSLEVPAGPYIVSATGGTYSGRGSVSITVGSQNMAVDFISGRPNGWVSFTEYVNAAPTLTTTTVSLPPVPTSMTNPAGALVSGLLGVASSDPNPLASRGIAVTAATSGSAVGSWQYSIDAGGTWQPLGSVSEGAARLLRGQDLVRFVPSSGSAAGSASISYRAWDQTSGVAGSAASTTTNGGSSAFSTGIATATVATILVNTAPVLSSTGGASLDPIPEDSTSPGGTTVAAIVGTAMSDVDPGTPAGIAVTATTGGENGAWQYSPDDGVSWVAVGTVSQASALLLRGGDKLRFVPVANFNGSATISYRAWDQSVGWSGMRPDLQASGAVGGNSAISLGSATASVTITPVNDAPTAVAGRSAFRLKPVATNSSFDFTGTTIADLLGNAVADIDAGALTGIAVIGLGSGGSWYWNTGGSSWGGGTVSPQFATLLRSTDRLGFQPNSGFTGETTVTFRLWDRTTGSAGFNQADLSNPSASTGETKAFGTEVLTARIFVGSAGSAPTAAFGAVSRSPDGRTVASIPVTFSKNVEGLDPGDFALTRGGVTVPLAAATLTGSGTSFVLGNLGDATALQGSYSLTLNAAMSGIADSSGNRPAANSTTTFSVATEPLAPTDISLSATTIAENNAAGALVGTFSTTDADSTSFTYTLVSGSGDTGNASFTISANQLRATASFDFETKSSYSIRVRSTDQSGLFFEKAFTITVTNVNEAPTDIALTAATLAENAGANAVVGTLSTTDPDAGNTFTYTLVSGTGSTDNAAFNISGSQLRATASFDFETKSSYSVRVRSTDQGGLSMEKAFTIVVTDVFEAPPSRPVFSGQLTTVGMTRVSTDAAGGQGNFSSSSPVFSPDGSKVAFQSDASNLVPGDTNEFVDIFVKNLVTGAITRVSTDAAGTKGDSWSASPVFSPDGSKVAFRSLASNLVPGDTNDSLDIFVKDLVTGAITRVSTDAGGTQGNSSSYSPVFSPDGSKVAFRSLSSNLVPGDTNDSPDIFVKDLATGAITRVSTDAAGAEVDGGSLEPVFSSNGSKVAFESWASNLVPGDTNGRTDIFVKDLVTGAITRVSTDAGGTQGNSDSISPALSPDGSKVAFHSAASNFVPGDTNNTFDIFVKDLVTGAITRVSTDAGGTQGNSRSYSPVFSPDGSKVAFRSFASNLVPGDTNNTYDIFVKDLVTGAITRVSTDAAGTQGNSYSDFPVFSPDGLKVGFHSDASNLVPGDTNGQSDVFVASFGFVLSVVEGTTPVATLTATDRDPGTTLTYSISGTDAARFTINAATGALAFRTAPSFTSPADAGSNNVYDIQVSVSDGIFTTTVPARITVTQAPNRAPTDIGLSATSILENAGANAVVGTFTTADPDANNTYTYSLVAGTGGTDNTAFNISGNQLRATASLNFETKSSYSVRVRTTDQGGMFFEKTFTITVTNVNETPTDISLSSAAIAENAAANAVVGTFTTADPDANNTYTYSLVAGTGGTDNTAFNISGNQLRATASLNFEIKSSYSVRVRTTDQGGMFLEKSFTITVTKDTTPPAPPAIVGVIDDVPRFVGNVLPGRLTNDNRLRVVGTAEPGSTVVVRHGGATLGTAIATAQGSWEITTITLADGGYVLTAIATDAENNSSGASTPSFGFTVDTVGPATPIILAVIDNVGAVTGNVASGSRTDDTTLRIVGTAAPMSRVTVRSGNAVLRSVFANASGNWAIVTDPLQVRLHNLNAVAEDEAGNNSVASGNHTVTIDQTRPTILSFGSTTPAGSHGQGSEIAIFARTSERMRAGSAIDVTLNTGAVVRLFTSSERSELNGTYQVAAGASASPLSIVSVANVATFASDIAGNLVAGIPSMPVVFAGVNVV